MTKRKKNYRKGILAISILLILIMISGCNSSKKSSSDDKIASDWALVEFTVKGTTTKAEDFPGASAMPAFTCTDGVNCVLSFNNKSHSGTLEEKDGVYTIHFDDTSSVMEARITGDTLKITIPGGTTEIVFETK